MGCTTGHFTCQPQMTAAPTLEGQLQEGAPKVPEVLSSLEKLSQATGGMEKSWYRCIFPFGIISLVIGVAGTGVTYTYNDLPQTKVVSVILLIVGLALILMATACWTVHKKKRRKKDGGSFSSEQCPLWEHPKKKEKVADNRPRSPSTQVSVVDKSRRTGPLWESRGKYGARLAWGFTRVMHAVYRRSAGVWYQNKPGEGHTLLHTHTHRTLNTSREPLCCRQCCCQSPAFLWRQRSGPAAATGHRDERGVHLRHHRTSFARLVTP